MFACAALLCAGVDAQAQTVPTAPTNLTAAAGDTAVTLSWDAPGAGADITGHEYRYKTDGDFPDSWTPIADSAPGGTNQAGFTVAIETNGLEHTFQVRAVNGASESPPSNEASATPQPSLTIDIDPNRVGEAAGSVQICVVRSAVSRQRITVHAATADGAATAPGDYSSHSTTVALQPFKQQACFTVTLVDDADHEGDEDFTVTLSDPVNATLGTPTVATITILANDPEVTIAAASTPITEQDGRAEFTLTRTAPLAAGLTVNITVSQTGAFIKTADSYTPPTTVAFEANQATATLSVDLDDDKVDEDDGAITATVTASTANDYAVGASAEAAVVVQDNDTRGLVLSKTALPLTEGGAAGAYTVKLATQPTATVTVTVDGAVGTDLTVSGPPLTFTTSTWGTEQTVTVTAGQDDDGTDDTVTLTHTASGGDYAGVTGDDVTVTVTDDDLPVVSIRADAASVSEADGSATFTLTRTMDTATTLTVAVTVSEEGDYLGTPIPVEAVFDPSDGETTLTVPIDDDDLDEADGAVTATVTDDDGAYEIGSEGEATVAVTDDDLPFVRLRETPGQPPHAAEGETIRFRVEREGDTSQALHIGLLVRNSFFVTAGRMHQIGETAIPPGVLLPIPAGQSFKDFSFPAYELGGFDFNRLGALGGRRQFRIQPDASYRTETVTEAHLASIDACSRNTDQLDFNCLRGGIPSKPYLQFFITSSRPVVIIETAAEPVEEGNSAAFTLTRIGGSIASLARALEVDLVVTETGEFIDGAPTTTATFMPGMSSTTLEIRTKDDDLDELDASITVEVTPRTAENHPQALERYDIVPDDAPTAVDYGERMVSVTVTDNDLPVISIAADAHPVEEGDTAEFTLSRTALANEQVEVTVDFTATGNLLSGAASAVAQFAQNARTASVSTATVEDRLVEADGTLTAAIRATAGYRVGDPATVTVTDDDLQIDLALAPIRVSEDGGGRTVTVTATLASGARTEATAVALTVSGSGDPGAVDFAPVTPFTLTITANQTSGQATFRLTPENDSVDETDETVTVSGAVAALPALVVNPATLTLADDDVPSDAIALTVNPTDVSEGVGALGATVTVTAMLNRGARAEATEVEVSVTGNTATAGTDFAAVDSFTLTIPAEAASGQASFTLTPADDDIAEGAETIAVSGAEVVDAGQTPAPVALPVSPATLTLTDNDTASTAIALSLTPMEVAEGAGATDVTVTAALNAGARTTETEVTVTVAGGSAVAGADFTAADSFTLTIPANADSGEAMFTLTPTDDDIAEGAETIAVSGTEVVDAGQTPTPVALPVSGATLTLTDNDTVSTAIALSVSRTQFAESDAAAEVTVTAMLNAGSRTADTELSVSVAGNTADAGDFAPVASFPLTIPATQITGAATFTLTPVADRIEEGTETITVSGRVSSGQTLPVSSAEITLTDVFTASTEVTLTVRPATVSERVGSRGQLVNVFAEMSAGARTAETVIRVTVSGSGAEGAVDFEPVQAFDLTIPANNTGGAATFSLKPVDDEVDETDETITVSGAVAALLALTVNAATLTLTDDDTASDAIALSLDRTEIAEGDGATTLTVTATLNGNARTSATAVEIAVSGSGVESAVDFTAVESFTLTIPPNQMSGEERFTLTPTDDTADETDETITVAGAVPALLALTVSPATLTLTDDDTAPSVSIGDASVGESAGPLIFEVTLSAASEKTVSVGYATASGAGQDGAAAGSDFTTTTGTLTFLPGVTSQDIEVPVLPDDLDESDETLAIAIMIGAGSADDLTLGDAAAVGTIVDDDDEVQVSVADASAGEGEGSIVFTVTLSRAFSQQVQVDWSATGDTATAGVDYTAPATPATLTFSPPETEKTITVSLLDDEQDEADETFHLDLSNPVGVAIGTARATGTIVDDDVPTVTISPLTAEVTEGAPASFTVTRVNHRQIPLTVLVDVTQDGDFLDGAAPTDLSFPADRDSVMLEVETDDDRTDEADGSVTAMLRADAANYVLGSPSSATVTVKDDEEPAISVVMKLNSIANVSAVPEDAGAIPITIEATTSLLRKPTQEIAFNIITWSDTARSPADFRQLSEQISILATDFSLSTDGTRYTATQTRDNTAQDLILTIVDDVVDEGNETFQIRVERGPGTASYVTLPPAETVITITDDDQIPGKPALSAAFGDRAATLNWSAPDDPGTSPIDGYDYRRSADGGTTWDPDWSEVPGGASVTSHTVESLVNGTEYTFEVRARSAAGDGEASDPVAVTPATTPDAPTGLTAARNGQTQIDLSWTAPARTGGAAIAGYFIESSPDGESTTWTSLVADTGSPATGYSDTGLAAGTTRHYRVSAINVAGTGMPSNTASATTDKPGLTVSETALTVTEGDAAGAGYTVVLGALPTGPVTVAVSGASGTDLTVSPASLTFTTGDWDQPQTVTVTAAEDADAAEDDVVTLTHTARDGGYDGLTAQVAVTIAENDTASTEVTLTVNPAAVSEGVGVSGAVVTVTAMLNAAPQPTDTEVTISVAPGTAAADDFTAVASFPLTIPALATSGTAEFTLTPVDDAVDEEDETVTVSGTVAQSSGLTVATPLPAVTITDDDTRGVAVSETALTVTEEDATGAGYTVVLESQPTGDVTVTVEGAAGTDVRVSPSKLTFTTVNWNQPRTVTVTAVEDADAAPDAVVTLTHGVTGYGSVTEAAGVAVTITDNDAASDAITLSVNPAAVSEGAGVSGETVTVTAMLNAGARTTATKVTVSVAAGTASADDFTAVADFALTIEALATSGSADFTLIPVDDAVAEGNETVTVSGTTAASGLTVATPGATVTITDNDTASTRIGLSVSHARVAEDAGATVVTVTAMLDAASRTADTVVTVSVAPGTGDAGDFTPVASFPLTIPATETSGTAMFTLTPSADRLEEGDETIAVRGTVTGAPSLRVSPATITLTDVFTASTAVTLSVAPATVSESVGSGGQLVNVTGELDGGARDAATVIQVSVTGSGAAGVVDFTPVASFPLTIPADHTGGAATFSLKPVNDEVDETDETITVSGTVAGLAVTAGTLMLTDDDTASSSIALSVNPAEVSEGVGVAGAAVTVTAMLNAAARTTATEVTVAVAAGTASADDFAAVTDFTLTIEALATSGSADFTLIPVDDQVVEGSETVTVSGTTAASGLTVATPGATVTITDNDTASTSIALSVNPAAVSEGVGVPGAAVTVTAMLNAAVRTTATEVTVAVAAGTAAADDFAAVTDFTLTIEALATSGSADFTLIPVDDDVAEGNETVTVSGTTAASGLTVATPGATVTITDNDAASSSIALSVDPAAVSEGVGVAGAAVTVTAMLNAAARTTATEVTVSVAAGTASADDFAAVTDFTLTIEALATSGSADFTLIPVDDDVAEGNETVTVSGTTAASGLTVATPGPTVTITDNDTVTASFATTAATATEGDTASFTVTLSGEAASAVALGWTTGGAGDTATSGADFTAVPAGALTFLPEGALTQTITVTTLQDTLAEASETFTVTLTGTTLPDGVTLGTATATGTITDDETLTAAVSGAATVAEGAEASFPVTLTGGTSTADVVVGYTVAGTATAGTDYTAPGGTLTIPLAQASGTITIRITADDVEEDPDDTLVVTLTSASTAKGTAAVDAAAATTTITDTVTPSDTISVTADAPHGLYVYNGREGSLREVPPGMYDDGPAPYVYEGEEATFTVTLSGGAATAAVEVSYEVGGEVTPGRRGDYTAPSGTLRIPRGSASGTIRIQTFLDVNGLTEFPERLEVTLTGATSTSGAVGVDPAGASAMLLLWEGKEYWVFVAETTATEYPTAEWTTFNVSLSRRLPVDVGVHWRTRDGTATAGEDYEASTGTVILPAGTASRDDGQVRLLNDDIAEDTETFKVELTGTNFPERVVEFPEGGWDAADLTIRDDDRLRASVTADAETVAEGGTAVFTVSLSKGVGSAPVLLDYEVSSTDANYSAADGKLTIDAGEESGTITIGALPGLDETLTVTLTAASTAKGRVSVDADAASATVAIKDTALVADNQQAALTVSVTSDADGPVRERFDVTFAFSREVTGFAWDDIEVGNGAVWNEELTDVDGSTWTASIEPAADFEGTVTVDVPAGAVEDADGAANEAAAQFAIAADRVAPTATVTSDAEAPVSEEFEATVAFDEPTSGFAMSDLEIANGRAARMAGLGDATEYTVYVAPDPDASGEVVIAVPAGVAADAAGNPNAASAPLSVALPASSPIIGFTLFDNATGEDLRELIEGAALSVLDSARLNVRAELGASSEVASVRMELTGARTSSRTENEAPYALFGDRGGQALAPGEYRVAATPYPERGLGGTPGTTFRVSFTVATVTGFTLFDSASGEDIAKLSDGAELPAMSSDDLNIRADIAAVTAIGSVRMELSGARSASRTENLVPYALFGDRGGSAFAAGEYRIGATPYPEPDLGGTPWPALGVTFAVAAGEDDAQDDAALPAISVADARATEGEDAAVDFAVTLGAASAERVTVDYATADGTAKAGEDYTAASGTLTFPPGETARTIAVTVLDDAKDEGEETFALRLSDASGATLADAEATGTITNTDPLPKAWLARFGRTAAGHAVDAVGERLRQPAAGSHLTIGGRRLDLPLDRAGSAWGDAMGNDAMWSDRLRQDRLRQNWLRQDWLRQDSLRQDRGRPDGMGNGGPWDGQSAYGLNRYDRMAAPSHAMHGHALLTGSSFRRMLGADEGDGGDGTTAARWMAWGRGAATRFDGADGALSVHGDVATATLGVDVEWERLLAGVAISHSMGDGAYALDGVGGRLASTLTSVHPYVRRELSGRLSMWAMLGYGSGDLSLTEARTEDGIETGVRMVMSAMGARGVFVQAAQTNGFELAGRSDALRVRTMSDAAEGMLAAAADTTRLRLVLEGSRGFDLGTGKALTPSLELGLRHDGGDAETGTGLELGAGLRYVDPAWGLTMEGHARALVAHHDSGYEEWGARGSIRLDPGASERGLSLSLSPSWGMPSSGIEGLWMHRTATRGGASYHPGRRLAMQVDYGFWTPFARGMLTPFAELDLSDGGSQRSRVGVVFNRPAGVDAGELRAELAGERIERDSGEPEHGIGLRVRLRFPRGDDAARSPSAPKRAVSSVGDVAAGRPGAKGNPDTSRAAAPGTLRQPAGGVPHFYSVQLGAFSTHAIAIGARSRLAGDLADLLGGRIVGVSAPKGDGLWRVVLAKVFAKRDQAAALCAMIETRGTECYVKPSPG